MMNVELRRSIEVVKFGIRISSFDIQQPSHTPISPHSHTFANLKNYYTPQQIPGSETFTSRAIPSYGETRQAHQKIGFSPFSAKEEAVCPSPGRGRVCVVIVCFAAFITRGESQSASAKFENTVKSARNPSII